MASDWVATAHRYHVPLTPAIAGRARDWAARRAGMAQVRANHATSSTVASTAAAYRNPSPASPFPSTPQAATKANDVNARSGRPSPASRSAGCAAARQHDAAARITKAAAATASSTADGPGRPAWRSAADTIPVAITMAKQTGSTPRAPRAIARPAINGPLPSPDSPLTSIYRDTIFH